MDKAEHVANEIVRTLSVQSGIHLAPEHALMVAGAAISVLEEVHEKKVRTALARWQKLNSEHKARGKKWLRGTGDMPHIPMASQPLPDYLYARMFEIS